MSADDAQVLTISRVLEHYGADMTRVSSSGWRPVKCPFHDDRHASAGVNLARDAFACHACGVHGDAIGLVMSQENLPYRRAVEWANSVLGASHTKLRDTTTSAKAGTWRDRIFD